MRSLILILTLLFSFVALAQVSGNKWADKQYSVSGGWSIVEDQGNYFLQLSDDFKTSKGPDLKLFLTTKPIAEIGNREAIEKHSLFVANLKSPKGEQRYQLPDGVNPSDFKGFAIHCEEFSVVWGGVDF